MSDLYTLNAETHTLTTSTCHMTDSILYNNEGVTYEEVALDLCRCMCASIESDDAQGKMTIGYALHTLLSSILDIS